MTGWTWTYADDRDEEQEQQAEQVLDPNTLTFHDVDRDDQFGKRYADPGLPPRQLSETEGGLYFDEFDQKNVSWEEHSLRFVDHDLDPNILAVPEPKEWEYDYKGPPGLYEAYRWPADGEEQRLRYTEDAKAEEAARRAAARHDPSEDPDPKPAPYLGNPAFTAEINSPTSRTVWVEYLPPEPTQDDRNAALTAKFDAELEQVNREFNTTDRELVDLYPTPTAEDRLGRYDPAEEPDPAPASTPYYGNPFFTPQSDIDEYRVADMLMGAEDNIRSHDALMAAEAEVRASMGLSPAGPQMSDTIHVGYLSDEPVQSGGGGFINAFAPLDVDHEPAFESPFAPVEAQASDDPVAEVQEVFPGAEEASGSGGWHLASDWGTVAEEGVEGEEGDDQDDDGGDNSSGGDGVVWSL